MKRHASVAFAVLMLAAGCTPETAKGGLTVAGYSKTVRELDITFYSADEMLGAQGAKTSGSIYGSSNQLARATSENFTDFDRAIGLYLEPTITADGIPASVETATTSTQPAQSRGKAHLLIIRPFAYRTDCTPCFTVADYRLQLADTQSRTVVWSREIKFIPKPDQRGTVQQFWGKIKDALRSDGLL